MLLHVAPHLHVVGVSALLQTVNRLVELPAGGSMSELAHSGAAPVTWGNFNTHTFLQITKVKCSLDINQACEQHKLNSYAKQYEERFDLSNRGGYAP
jgi:hypothetical protein